MTHDQVLQVTAPLDISFKKSDKKPVTSLKTAASKQANE
jgi:hypothetical protein